MDGNGRWAQKQGENRIHGHQSAVQAVRDTVEACGDLGVKYLTLFAFSTENWNRPQEEINGLMELLVNSIKNESETLMKNNIRLLTIGNTESLPIGCRDALKSTMDLTKNNTGSSLILALSYSGKWDILQAAKSIAQKVKRGDIEVEDIDDQLFEMHLNTGKEIPNPELMIRTSGEMRISNFLLWQLAYSEIYITPTLWPDFRKKDLYEAVIDYQQRERRFGLTGQQVSEAN